MFARHHFEEYGSISFGNAEEDHGVIPQPHLPKNQQLLEFEFEQETLDEIHDIMLNGDDDLVMLALIASTLIVSCMFFRAWYFMLSGSNFAGIFIDSTYSSLISFEDGNSPKVCSFIIFFNFISIAPFYLI